MASHSGAAAQIVMSQIGDLLDLFISHGHKLTLGQIRQTIMRGKNPTWSDNECWPWPFGRTTAGYGEVRLVPNSDPLYTHRISAALFHGYKFEKNIHVLHKCDNKPCFNPSHLYLGTRKDNARDAVERGLHLQGEKCPWAKLTKQNILEIRKAFQDGITQQKLADRYGVNQPTISRAIHRICWKTV